MPDTIRRVVALGFFDGIHVGHSALLELTCTRAQEYGAAPAVMTFDTHPEQLVKGVSVELINSTVGRAEIIRSMFNIEDVIVLRFDEKLMHMDSFDFIRELKEEDNAVHLVVGHDFHFGYKGSGNPIVLHDYCQTLGLGLDVVPEITIDGITVSSTYIRQLISEGDMERASKFLGHPHMLVDAVRYGFKRGRRIGAPTINMCFPDGVLVPRHGVYAAKVILEDGPHMAVTNIGVRPTFGGKDEVTVESYILDFSGDLYGRQVRVEFHKFLRAEKKFDSIDELKLQIQSDAEETRRFFAS